MAEFIKFAFSAGEVAPNFLGRPDLEKFDFGVKKARNWFVDYRGGISTRPGLEYIDVLSNPARRTRLAKFEFNKLSGNTYIIVFGHNYIRFVQNGSYIFETGKTLSGVSVSSPGVFTSTAHGFSNGDLIQLRNVDGMSELNLRTFLVRNSTTNTFTLERPDGEALSTIGLGPFGGGSGAAQRVYTLTSTYDETQVDDLVFDQFRDILRITHPDHPPRRLTRSGSTSWALADINFDQDIAGVDDATGTPSATAAAGVIYAVTRVNLNGVESSVAERVLIRNATDITATAGHVDLEWGDYENTAEFRVYRSIFYPDGAQITKGEALGYIGSTSGTSFTDNNIAPDFAQSPPLSYNPFADRAVRHINITARGSGYDDTLAVTVTGGSGSGFVGETIVLNGELVGINILSAGANYGPTPTVSFSGGGGGTGAAATATVSDASGNNPRAITRYEQRTVYAGTGNLPMSLFGSRPGKQNAFNFTSTGAADDSFVIELDSRELTPIKFLQDSPIGLLTFTESGVYQVYGTGNNRSALSGENGKSTKRTSNGSGDVQPIDIDDNIIYVQAESSALRALQPSDKQGFYDLADLSIYSNHLFSPDNQVTSMAYAQHPFRILWMVREDGTMLAFTYVPEHNVYAFTRCETQGWFESVEVVREDGYDRAYFVVRRRRADGTYIRFLERLDLRRIQTPEDMWAVDSGLALARNAPAAGIVANGATGTISVTADAAVFSPTDVGKHFRAGGGRGLVASYVSATEITVDLDLPILDLGPETITPPRVRLGRMVGRSPRFVRVGPRSPQRLHGRDIRGRERCGNSCGYGRFGLPPLPRFARSCRPAVWRGPDPASLLGGAGDHRG